MGMFCRAANRGAGIIGDLRGVVASNVIDASVETAEVVTQTTLLVVAPELTGVTTITDNYGLYIGDHSGQASGDNFNIWSQGASSENLFDGLIQTGSLRIDQAPTANISAATTITSGADSATNLGHRVMINLNGVDYWIPCGTTPF
jgi:hypothetical protein